MKKASKHIKWILAAAFGLGYFVATATAGPEFPVRDGLETAEAVTATARSSRWQPVEVDSSMPSSFRERKPNIINRASALDRVFMTGDPAYPGTDRNGPYALMTSATCWDHAQSQNSQMNMKIHPSAIKGEEGSRKLLQLIRSYMRKGGYHVQFNVVDTKMLRDAQAHPENYRDLMVRVAGFTQYWVEIGKAVQDEVIARTEYEGV